MMRLINRSIIVMVVISTISCNETPYMQGMRLYNANCLNCHMEDGSGLEKLIPPLSSSVMLGNAQMACIIKNGIQDTIKSDSHFLPKVMPSFAKLSATEVTNIINYINHKYHQPFIEQTILEVQDVLKKCQ